jgi:uncharacterized protein (DUF952 family)
VAFTLSEVVPWGRSFAEYVSMFALSPADLVGSILGCGDGPASFNAELTRRGGSVTSVDPLYAFRAEEIRARVQEVTPVIIEQTRQSAGSFVWTHIRSVDHLKDLRLAAMEMFLSDFRSPDAARRYHAGSLPTLPYADGRFDLALCSHFLFLYSSLQSCDFHVDAVAELCRVAAEARIFPLLALDGAESTHLEPVTHILRERGFTVERHTVPYEFQRGGNQMLVARAPSAIILHLATMAAWNDARQRGLYAADSLTTEGFIHCSDPRQAIEVANRLFSGRHDLVLLRIEVARLKAPLRYENFEGGSELYPHVYGPLPTAAVVRAAPFQPHADGRFAEEQVADALAGSRPNTP